MKRFAIVLHVTLVACLCSCRQAERSTQGIPGPNEARQRKLFEAVGSDDCAVARRGVQELKAIVRTSARVREVLADLFADDEAFFSLGPDLIAALASAGKSAVPMVLDRLKRADISEGTMAGLLMVLGRIGPEAKEGIPVVLAKLKETEGDPFKSWIPVVLHNIGYDAKESIAAIRADIAERNEAGAAAVSFMANIGGLHWVTPEILNELPKWVAEAPGDESSTAAIVLAIAGQRMPREGAEAIRRTLSNYDGYISGGLLVARMSPPKSRKEPLRIGLKSVGSEGVGGEAFRALTLVAPVLVSDEIYRDVVAMLSDPDPDVCAGAAVIIAALGMPADEAIKPLLTALAESDSEKLRKAAAACLAYVLPESEVGKLEELLETEKSEWVCREISDSVRIIRLEEEGGLGSPLAGLLVKGLTDEDPFARALAAKILGELGRESRGAIPALTKALQDESQEVRKAAKKALDRIRRGESLAKDEGPIPDHLLRSLADGDEDMRVAVVDRLANFGPVAIPVLTKALKDKSEAVRKAAAAALDRIRQRERDAANVTGTKQP